MKKSNVLWIVLDSIFLIIFNAIFFIMGGVDHEVSVWVSYVFIHFAYFMLLLTPFFIRKEKSSTVFGFSLYSISSCYFILELIVGVVFILVSSESWEVTFLIQLCIAGVYGILLVINMISNEHTATEEEKRQHQLDYVKQASMMLKNTLDIVSDKETKKKVEKVYDALYSSPVKSHPNLTQAESHILVSINELHNAASSGDKNLVINLANALLIEVNERNQQLKTLN